MFDPTAAALTLCGETQSPAIKLYHELEHLFDLIHHDRQLTLTEKDIITGPEADLAKSLGEDVRTSYKAIHYRVGDPRSREPVDEALFRDMELYLQYLRATKFKGECSKGAN